MRFAVSARVVSGAKLVTSRFDAAKRRATVEHTGAETPIARAAAQMSRYGSFTATSALRFECLTEFFTDELVEASVQDICDLP